jgi:signal peptidase I
MKNLLGVWQRLISSSRSCSCGRRPLVKLALVVVLSFVSYLVFSHLIVTAVEVKGASMAPTLTAGDRLLLNRFAYLHREPQRGELVVVKDPETGDLIVKRIIGLPCETIIMQNENAFVNGHRLIEPYATTSTGRTNRAPLGKATVIPRNHYFVLGDNRMRSVDSRHFGTVSKEQILGVISL